MIRMRELAEKLVRWDYYGYYYYVYFDHHYSTLFFTTCRPYILEKLEGSRTR
jgi:hypothetical protein